LDEGVWEGARGKNISRIGGDLQGIQLYGLAGIKDHLRERQPQSTKTGMCPIPFSSLSFETYSPQKIKQKN